MTANRSGDSLDEVDSPACAGSGIATSAQVVMHLHVNSNLALELPPDTVPSPAPKKKIDPRA
ncbi:MAG: hypothetical protein WA366_18440, partial [Pseudolabrys sp.]